MIILVFIVGETGIILPCTVRSGCTFKTLILHTFMLPPTSDSDIGLVQDSSLTYSLLAAVERRARSSCLENVCGFLEYSSTLFFLQFNWCITIGEGTTVSVAGAGEFRPTRDTDNDIECG
uniref:Uncharacterized protein n=1 Tax=Opuntia streptacantha TaxID=393608 RepID=A0A7C8ZR52_OPUST